MTVRRRFPRRWQDCEPFLRALAERQYAVIDTMPAPVVAPDGRERTLRVIGTPLTAGAYLYMYECWQDGFVAGYGEHARVTTRRGKP